jgi:hypothetical protein
MNDRSDSDNERSGIVTAQQRGIIGLTIFLVLVGGCGRAKSTPTPVPTPTAEPLSSWPFDTAWDDRTRFREGLTDESQDVLDELSGASVYQIDVSVSDDLLLLEGHEQVHYTNQEAESLDRVCFWLYPNRAGGRTTVSGLRVDGQDADAVYEYEDSVLCVTLPSVLRPGEQVDIDMGFDVVVAQEMAGNYGLFGYFDGVLVLDEFYPVVAVYDDEGWRVRELPPNGDVTYLDASFYLVRITAPAELLVVTSGIEVDREELEDSVVLAIAAGPARDFYVAASEQFRRTSTTVGETKVNSYAFGDRREGAELALGFAVDALESYGARFGPYPYTEFDVVSTPMQALGMEYPGIVGIGLGLYDPEAVVSGLPSQILMESVVAHETAHQWFYNVVGNDQVEEPWLDEAVVQYATGLYYVDVYGEAAAGEYRQSWVDRWDRVEQAELPIGLPSGDYAQEEYSPIVYGRGPIFLTALAEEMGQEVFAGFLRDYYETHQWGIGTTEAFRQLAEEHCQCDLTALFREWVYGE